MEVELTMELYPFAMHTAPEGVFLSTISVLATLFGWKFASPLSHAPKAMPKTKEPASKAFVTPPISSPDHQEFGFEVLAIPLLQADYYDDNNYSETNQKENEKEKNSFLSETKIFSL